MRQKNIKENDLCKIKYDNLVAEPAATIEFVNSKLLLMKEKLLELQAHNKNYKANAVIQCSNMDCQKRRFTRS